MLLVQQSSSNYLVYLLFRPGFGSVAFRNSISAFNALSVRGEVDILSGSQQSTTLTQLSSQEDYKEDSIGSAGSLANRSVKSNERVGNLYDEEEEEDLSDGDSLTGENYTSLHMFLAAIGLSQWSPAFVKEKIDLEALMLLSEADLSDSLGMPLGSRKKLMKAIKDRRAAIEEPDELTDNRL